MANETLTWTPSAPLQVGDVVSMNVPLSRWQRFLIWVAQPTRWPPREAVRRFKVSAVVNGTSAELSDGRTTLR